jgi:hypothetical protein
MTETLMLGDYVQEMKKLRLGSITVVAADPPQP